MELGAGIGPGETGEGNKGAGGSCVKGCLVLRWLIDCSVFYFRYLSKMFEYFLDILAAKLKEIRLLKVFWGKNTRFYSKSANFKDIFKSK